MLRVLRQTCISVYLSNYSIEHFVRGECLKHESYSRTSKLFCSFTKQSLCTIVKF